MALATESTYVHWLRQYISALKSMPATLSSEKKLELFLTHLARHRDLSASSQNQAFNAILYFYKEVLRQLEEDQIDDKGLPKLAKAKH